MQRTVLTVLFIFFLSSFLAAQTRQASQNRKGPPIIPEAEFMVNELLIPQGELHSERVLDAMKRVPREQFVPPLHRLSAFYDKSLPIGNSQTISSPSVVAYMTEMLDPQPEDRVLEIGTGSGYQAAVLSLLVKEVYSIEIVQPLGKRAEKTLKRLGYKNVFVWVGDGYKGWPSAAPFDKIIVTCSPELVPQPLVDQLKEGGRMIIPVGERYQQRFYLFKKNKGELEQEALTPVLFVPMTGEAEEQRTVLPNPDRPEIIGGNFEETTEEGTPIGWYYARNAVVIEDKTAPKGTHFLRLQVQPDPNSLFQQQYPQQQVQQQALRPVSPFGFETGFGRPSQNAGTGQVPANRTNKPDNSDDKENAKNPLLPDLKIAQVMQGFAINGKKIPHLKLDAVLRGENLQPFFSGQNRYPGVIWLYFYDDAREEIQQLELAPVYGSFSWKPFSTVVAVPRKTEEIILFIGLFNVSGQLDIDNISIQSLQK